MYAFNYVKAKSVKESAGRGVGGSWAGALAALYTAVKRPKAFGRLGTACGRHEARAWAQRLPHEASSANRPVPRLAPAGAPRGRSAP